MQVAKSDGWLRGRQLKLAKCQVAHLMPLTKGRRYMPAETAELFGARARQPDTKSAIALGLMNRTKVSHQFTALWEAPLLVVPVQLFAGLATLRGRGAASSGRVKFMDIDRDPCPACGPVVVVPGK